jgi:mRNA-degrading endonuclease HigB of HigAB toxin-antitoxin module
MSSEMVTGQSTMDKFVYQTPSSGYAVSSMYNVLTITSLSSSEVDQLTGVERIKFTDKSIAFDIEGNAGQAYRVYRAAFGRDPIKGDMAGLGFWISQIDKGMNLLEVAARFIDSSEFAGLYGLNSSNSDFLSKLYTNVLGRTPDQAGFGWWLDQLNTNPEKTRRKVLADFSESVENKQAIASLIGNGIPFFESSIQ